MNKTKNNLKKNNSSGWLDNYSEDFSIDKYAEGGGVWEDIKEELNTEVVNPIKNFFFPKETKKKVYTDPKTLPKSFNLQDNRKINPITKKALNPTKDLKNFKGIDKENVQAIIKMADYLGYPRDLALAVSLQESGLGKIDDNLGHNLDYYFDPRGKNELFTEEEIEAGAFITGLKEKANYAKTLYNQKKIPKNDLIYQLQAYNGFGKLNPNTEIDYYENPNQKFYGVDVKGKPLSLKDNPLYGKTIINFRDSIINQDPTLKKFLNLPKYYEDGGPIFKKIEVTSPSDNTRRTIDSPINLMTKEQLKKLDKANYLKVNEEKAQIANRNKRIKLADKARKEDATIENMALRASVLGDRMRFFPNENNIIDDLNPLRYIGDYAGNVGQIPLNIKEGDYGQAALNLGIPLVTGAIGGIGSKNTAQFVNNLTNPLAGVGDLVKAGVSRLSKKPIPKIDWDNYLTQEQAVQARAERMLAQENKWRGQNNPELRDKFKNAVDNHNPSGDYPASRYGVNKGNFTMVSKDVPLNEANQARIAAHETGHYYRNVGEEADEWNKLFDLSKTNSKTERYLKGKSNTLYSNENLVKKENTINILKSGTPHGDELRERAAQLKDYIAQKNNIPLNKDFTITQSQLNDAIKNYVKNTKLDNSMIPFLKSIKDKKGLLNMMNKSALVLTPAMVGTGYMMNNQEQDGGYINNDTNKKTKKYQEGGTINNNMKKKIKKYPEGGYLTFQEGYKGFGMGPELYQDNSYFRSIMPDNIENMDDIINKPSVFSKINDVLGGIDQVSSKTIGFLGNFMKKNMTGYDGLSDSAKSMFDYSKMMNNAEQGFTGLNFDNTNLPSMISGIGGEGQTFGGFGSQGNKGILQGLSFINKNGGRVNKYQDGGEMDMLPVGAPEYIHKSNVFNEQYNPVPRVHFSDDTTAYDMGVNLNDLVNMNGGRIRQYAAGGFAGMYGNSYGGVSSSPRLFNSNTNRSNLAQLKSASQNDFLNTKVRKDRQSFEDDKVDWGAFNFLKEPTGAVLGTLSAVPIVGDFTKEALGDSFLTRTGGYTVGQGVGKGALGAAKIITALPQGNVGQIMSGVGDIGEGVGSTVGNLNANSAMSSYDKSGYISGKRLARASEDFNDTMGLAGKLYGTGKSTFDLFKKPGPGSLNSFLGNQTPYSRNNKKNQDFNFLMKSFMPNLGGMSFGQDGGYIDENMFMVEEYKNGGFTKKTNTKINNKNKQVTGWLDQL